jgi:hypothetical protein
VGLRTLSAAGAILLIALPAAAQTTVRSIRLTADLSPDDGGAEVSVEYVLDIEGTPQLRVQLLGFGDASTESFWLGERRTGTPIRLTRESGSLMAADFTLSFGETDADVELVANYWIPNAVERDGARIRVHVPVLTLATPPAEGIPDLFQAEFRLPPSWEVSESFPTGMRATGDGSYAVDLAVSPSVVSIRARTDGAWRPGLPLVLEMLMAAALVAFGIGGWRHLRSVAA